MKQVAFALVILTFLAATVGFAGARDEPIPIVYSGHDLDGSTLTVHLTNTSQDPASATLTVYVMSDGEVVETLVAPVSLPGSSAGSIQFYIAEGPDPIDPLGFRLS